MPDDGFVVLDLAELFDGAGDPWARVVRWRFGQAELAQFFAAGVTTPQRVVVAIPPQRWTIEPVSRLAVAAGSVEIFTEAAGGPETSAGRAAISPTLFAWTPEGAATVSVPFTGRQDREIDAVLGGGGLQVDWTEGTALSARFTERANPLSGELDRTLTLVDRSPALQAGSTIYYTAFQGTEAAASQAVLIAGPHGFPERLFALLPSVHQHYDNPASGHGGSWQLRRFLGIFGAALDHAQGTAEALPSLFDPLTARADMLPYLAQQIGWPLDRTLSTERQRGDILFAPEVFATIGTVPNVQALANRTTGWGCRVKEYADNVLLTNAAEPIRLWQIFETTSASPADAFTAPAIQPDIYPPATEPASTEADPARADARPAAVTAPDGTIWLFWHSTPPGAGPARRRIWLQRLGIDPAPLDALADMEDAPDLCDEAPAAVLLGGTVWLAWASNRGGHQEIWLRAWPGAAMPPGPARRLTQQRAENRTPALAASGSTIAAAWASTQSGQTMIWTSSSTDDGATWSPPAVASPGPRDRTPAAAIDPGGQLHLFWSADGGVSSHIRHRTPDGSVTDATIPAPAVHDEAPCVVPWQGSLRLFWHSNRFAPAWRAATAYKLGALVADGNGSWFECTRAGTSGAAFPAVPGGTVIDGGVVWTGRGAVGDAVLAQRTRIWSAAGPLAAGAMNAMQPAAVVTPGGGLRLFLASQETGARLRSRTVDTTDALARASMGSFADRMHYTYDTRRVPGAVVARDTAALFLTPDDDRTVAEHEVTVQRLRAFFAPFRPVTTRFVYLVEHSAGAGFTPIASDP